MSPERKEGWVSDKDRVFINKYNEYAMRCHGAAITILLRHIENFDPDDVPYVSLIPKTVYPDADGVVVATNPKKPEQYRSIGLGLAAIDKKAKALRRQDKKDHMQQKSDLYYRTWAATSLIHQITYLRFINERPDKQQIIDEIREQVPPPRA